jgi:hypothetical protein
MSDIRFQSIEDGDLADIWYALGGSAARHPDHFQKLMDACFQELMDRARRASSRGSKNGSGRSVSSIRRRTPTQLRRSRRP